MPLVGVSVLGIRFVSWRSVPDCPSVEGNLRYIARCSRGLLAALLSPYSVCFGLAVFLGSAVSLAAQNQRLVYASNAKTSLLYGWVVNPAQGTLTPIPGSPFSERLDPYAIAVHPSGKFLYVINQIANDVSAFSIDPDTGALTELLDSPFAAGSGTDPVGIAADPSGKFLYVVNASSKCLWPFWPIPRARTFM
jgi:DNA-binding beta-propeller fold protein YncE